MARPVADVALSARAYSRRQGLAVPETRYGRTFITQPALRAAGEAYQRLPEFDSGALPAYHAMREETMRQFDHMTGPRSKGGLGLHVETQDSDPYGPDDINKIYGELKHDVTENNRIKVLSTAATGGHPVFSNDENDAFRAVHDVYGHLGTGRGVDHSGEEAAFQKHSRMFSPLARQAMTSETRGQNAAFHVGGGFQDQKIGLLPAHMQGLQFSRLGAASDIHAAAKQMQKRNREQGV